MVKSKSIKSTLPVEGGCANIIYFEVHADFLSQTGKKPADNIANFFKACVVNDLMY